MDRKLINKILKAICIFALSLIFIGVFPAMAEEKEAEIFSNDRVQSFTVTVTYEKDDAELYLVSPSGTVYDTAADNADVSVIRSEGSVVFMVKDGEEGAWKLKYDKGSNNSISYYVSLVSTKSFRVDGLTIGEQEGGRLPFSFTSSGDDADSYYEYRLMAVTDTSSTNGTELYSGRAKIGERVEEEADLSYLSTFSEYYLCLYATYNDGTFDYFDYSYSSAFSYENPDSPEKPEGVFIEIDTENDMCRIDWSEAGTYGMSEMLIRCYEEGALVSTELFDTDDREASLVYTQGAKKLEYEVCYKDNKGLISEPLKFSINLEEMPKITMPEDGLVYSAIWNFEVEDINSGANAALIISVNGAEEESIELKDNGSYRIKLSEDYNKIVLKCAVDKNIWLIYRRTANLSIIPPSLEIYNSLDGMKTDKAELIIQGRTDADSLTVNGSEVQMLANGAFAYEFALEEGKNYIVIEAKTGELVTAYNAVVTREATGNVITDKTSPLKAYLPMLISFCFSIIAAVILIIITRKKKVKAEKHKNKKAEKKNENGAKPRKKGLLPIISSVIAWILAGASWVWFIIRTVFENSSRFIVMAAESLKRADSYLFYTKLALVWAIVITVISAGLTIWAVIVRLLNKRKLSVMQR